MRRASSLWRPSPRRTRISDCRASDRATSSPSPSGRGRGEGTLHFLSHFSISVEGGLFYKYLLISSYSPFFNKDINHGHPDPSVMIAPHPTPLPGGEGTSDANFRLFATASSLPVCHRLPGYSFRPTSGSPKRG